MGLFDRLAHEPGPPLHVHPCQAQRQKDSPSWQHHRERRAAGRRHFAEEAEHAEHHDSGDVVGKTTTQENRKTIGESLFDTEKVDQTAAIAKARNEVDNSNKDFEKNLSTVID